MESDYWERKREQKRQHRIVLLKRFLFTFGVWLLSVAAITWFFKNKEKLASAFQPAPGPNYVGRICPDAWQNDKDYSDSDAVKFDVVLKEGCWSGWFTPPTWWPEWHWQQDTAGDWVAIWYSGGNPKGPFFWNQTTIHIDYPPSRTFRLQGKGKLLIYTNLKERPSNIFKR